MLYSIWMNLGCKKIVKILLKFDEIVISSFATRGRERALKWRQAKTRTDIPGDAGLRGPKDQTIESWNESGVWSFYSPAAAVPKRCGWAEPFPKRHCRTLPENEIRDWGSLQRAAERARAPSGTADECARARDALAGVAERSRLDERHGAQIRRGTTPQSDHAKTQLRRAATVPR